MNISGFMQRSYSIYSRRAVGIDLDVDIECRSIDVDTGYGHRYTD